MYIVFIDETGDHNLETIDSQYPVFSLNAVIFEKYYYYSEVTKKFHQFKQKYFRTKDIILHSYSIKKQIAPLDILVKEHIRNNFYQDLNELIKQID